MVAARLRADLPLLAKRLKANRRSRKIPTPLSLPEIQKYLDEWLQDYQLGLVGIERVIAKLIPSFKKVKFEVEKKLSTPPKIKVANVMY